MCVDVGSGVVVSGGNDKILQIYRLGPQVTDYELNSLR